MGMLGILVGAIAFVLWLLVLGRAVFSWIDPAGRTTPGRFVIAATEPFLAPIRRRVPPAGGLDISALLVLIVLGAIWGQLL
jgi:YggT family protein